MQKQHNIAVGPGRGSAAGSIVAYSLRITDIDPIKYGLIFERFLQSEREACRISTWTSAMNAEERSSITSSKIRKRTGFSDYHFRTMKAKAAVRDVGRVLQMGYAQTDAIAKMIPFDLHMTIDKALSLNPELKQASRK